MLRSSSQKASTARTAVVEGALGRFDPAGKGLLSFFDIKHILCAGDDPLSEPDVRAAFDAVYATTARAAEAAAAPQPSPGTTDITGGPPAPKIAMADLMSWLVSNGGAAEDVQV